MKKFTFLIILLTLSGMIPAQTPVPPGPVSGTWDLAGSPYMINGEIYINSDETLIIEAGVEVLFNGWFKFLVYGRLEAQGAEGDSILFTAADTNNRWHGIRFSNSSEHSELNYCRIEYGLTSDDPNNFYDNCGGGVLINACTGEISIKHCLLQNNIAFLAGGIEIVESDPIIENCKLINNLALSSGGAIECYVNASPIIKNTVLSHNSAGGHGGAIQLFENCNASIIGCTITYNHCENMGGGIQSYVNTGITLERNLIAFNTTDSIGGGINFSGTQGVLRNNTICYNSAPNYRGGGLHFKFNSNPVFMNNIIYANTSAAGPQVYIEDTFSDPDFIYCDIEDGISGFDGPGAGIQYTGDTTGTFDEDPMFIAPLLGNFQLGWPCFPETGDCSPCIDAGNPAILYNDPDGTRNDVGAYYFDQMPETPVAYEVTSNTPTSFEADWSSCYGASGYILIVAHDPEFTDTVEYYNPTSDTTSCYNVTNLSGGDYYYKVKAWNSACTTQYSNTAYFYLPPTAVNELDADPVRINTLNKKIYIVMPVSPVQGGEAFLYNLGGQLLAAKKLTGGNNIIDPNCNLQIIIVAVMINGNSYHRKVLLR